MTQSKAQCWTWLLCCSMPYSSCASSSSDIGPQEADNRDSTLSKVFSAPSTCLTDWWLRDHLAATQSFPTQKLFVDKVLRKRLLNKWIIDKWMTRSVRKKTCQSLRATAHSYSLPHWPIDPLQDTWHLVLRSSGNTSSNLQLECTHEAVNLLLGSGITEAFVILCWQNMIFQ